jgi:hypothetical protein
MVPVVFEFLGWLVEEKIYIKILLASGSRIIISLSVIGRFSPESTPQWMQKKAYMHKS